MINKSITQDWLVYPFMCITLMIGLSLSQVVSAANITLDVEISGTDGAGAPTLEPLLGFRYLVEEDTTIRPNVGVQDDYESLSFEFHRSHNPVATHGGDDINLRGKGVSGSTAGSSVVIDDLHEDRHYFISVVPFNGGTVGGVSVHIPAGQGTTTVPATAQVNAFPIPTAQIKIWIFEDNNPVNGALDIDERRLSATDIGGISGPDMPFGINLFDAGGQYGAAGGHVVWDAYGNPLGTEYDVDGNITSTPDNTNGFVLTPDQNGELIIKHLYPGKYGVQVVPPVGQAGDPIWVQTSTIEGSRTIDAWVKANEPETFVEFGPPGPHVFVGFTRVYDCLTAVTDPGCLDVDGDPVFAPVAAGTGATISGQVVNNHIARPQPSSAEPFAFAAGELFEGCRVALNLGIAGRTIHSQPCGGEAKFSIANIPVGTYSISIWDDGLNVVIASHAINVSFNGATNNFEVTPLNAEEGLPGSPTNLVACDVTDCQLGQIPVFDWFHYMDSYVFHDRNENGYRDCTTDACNDPAVDDVPLSAESTGALARFRDGRVYNGLAVDFSGNAPLEEVFPFFHWLVAEVDFANYKATGATFTVDDGGGTGGPGSFLQDNGYVPQPQLLTSDGTPLPPCGTDPTSQPAECTFDGGDSRTETGPVLTAAFQGFLGQKNTFEFGKKAYGDGENGGISGVIVYAITRAEDDPAYAAAEEWEPGIPRAQVALYKDSWDTTGADVPGGDQIIDDINGVGGIQETDVDNHPLGWADPSCVNDPAIPGNECNKGREDIDQSCVASGNAEPECLVAAYNLAVFDQGDAFQIGWSDSWDDSQPENCGGLNDLLDPDTMDPLIPQNKCFDGLRNWNQVRPGVFDGGYAFGPDPDIGSGYYIVKSYAPPGYTLLKEEDKNVDFGDEYAVPTLLPTACIGEMREVPLLLSHVTVPDGIGGFTQVVDGDPLDYLSPVYEALGDTLVERPLCDARHIRVAEGKNAAADFHYFTEVPKAAHVVGGVINDLGNEFNPLAPTFGEKYAPPWVPVAFYDYKGYEITRVYTDQFGKYNAMLPSTNTVNVASPSGVAPNMITACMNDSGQVADPSNPGATMVDPRHNPQYSQFCYVFQYMPGGTTYLDTPVLQIAAFAGDGKQLDCAASDATPMIASVTSGTHAGPYVNRGPGSGGSRLVTITSLGMRDVPNPSVDGLDPLSTITRDFGFGDVQGSVDLYDEDGNWVTDLNLNQAVTVWTDSVITARVRGNATVMPEGSYQLVVTRGDNGASSPMGVTLTVGSGNLTVTGGTVTEVFPSTVTGETPIQTAIDNADVGDLLLIAEGTYNEIPIMWKPLFLQGAGADVTTINARSAPTELTQNWHEKIDSLLHPLGQITLIPGQEDNAGLLATEAGAGVTVVGPQFGPGSFNSVRRSRIDGFTITGASTGGGVFANGFISYLQVSNNLISGNQGTYGGGVRLGHFAIQEQVTPTNGDAPFLRWPNAQNRDVRIRHNMITQNGNINGAGGGISIYNDSDRYQVTDNLICGNFAATDGAGIGHLGRSPGGLIRDNTIIFNQSFRQTPGFETDGGGILIAGNPGLNGLALSDGSGSVWIDRNLIQGNQAGAGDGGGIALRDVNGVDIRTIPWAWWWWDGVRVRNNTIVNNVAGLAGGGISLRDAARVYIDSNTIANNDSTATAGLAFELPDISTAQVAGIVARAHLNIAGLITNPGPRWNQEFSNPFLNDNIIRHNRSSYYVLATNELLPRTITDPYWDLGVVGIAGSMDPRASLLTDATGYNADNLDDGDVFASGVDVFVNEYHNGNPFLNPSTPSEFTTIQVAPALDEGGNWIDARYAPLSINDVDAATPGDQASDYHLFTDPTGPDSVAIDAATGTRPGPDGGIDIDLETGTVGTLDMGSDEVQP